MTLPVCPPDQITVPLAQPVAVNTTGSLPHTTDLDAVMVGAVPALVFTVTNSLFEAPLRHEPIIHEAE